MKASEKSSPPCEKLEKPKKVSFPESKNFSWKSFIKWALFGYLVGMLGTILWFLYDTCRTTFLEKKPVLFFLVLLLIYGGLLLCSQNVRILSLLILPILFSKKGRSLLIASAFVLAATGPTMNIMKNVDVMMKSISCGQEQLKHATEQMLDLIKRPLVAVKNVIKNAIAEVKKVLKRVEELMIRLRNTVEEILGAIKKAWDWLGNVISMCNKKFGTPFQRCIKIADDAMADCKEKMGIFKGLCNVTHVFRALCYSVKFIDSICEFVDFISDSVIQTIEERLQKFNNDIKEMFYVSVKFDHEFNFKTIATKNFTTIGKDIWAELRSQMNEVFILFGWMEFLGSFMVFLVVLKALLYKNKYLKSDRFDNHFITKTFIDINERRKEMGKDVVLPLTRKEKGTYVMINSFTLVRAELFKLSSSIVFLTISSIQLICICLTDYSLYWLLSVIRHFGELEADVQVPPFLKVNVSGEGFTADIVKGIVHAFEPLTEGFDMDPRPCLPIAKVPSFSRYWEIGIVTTAAWIFLFCQPYGLRLRQVIMGSYYPDRARQRALWLYNEILLKRSSFIKLARRQARQKFLKDNKVEVFSFTDWLRARLNRFWIFRKIFGTGKLESCNICATPLKEENSVKCQQMGCVGMYCAECYAEMENTCCMCKRPIDYGDLSDVSEEKDSSDEELEEVRTSETDKICSRFA